MRRWVTAHWRLVVVVSTVLVTALGVVADVLGIGSVFLGLGGSASQPSPIRKGTARATAPGLPRYTGQITNFSPAKKLTDFLDDHLDQRVYINSFIEPDVRPLTDKGDYDPYAPNTNTSIQLWYQCFRTLKPGEKPDETACLGTQISILGRESPGLSGIKVNNDSYFLRGYFGIVDISGPQMGIMTYTLQPISITDVR